jgi:hypothetical protein
LTVPSLPNTKARPCPAHTTCRTGLTGQPKQASTSGRRQIDLSRSFIGAAKAEAHLALTQIADWRDLVRRRDAECAVGRAPASPEVPAAEPGCTGNVMKAGCTQDRGRKLHVGEGPVEVVPQRHSATRSQSRWRRRHQYRRQNRRGADRSRLHAAEVAVFKKWTPQLFVNVRVDTYRLGRQATAERTSTESSSWAPMACSSVAAPTPRARTLLIQGIKASCGQQRGPSHIRLTRLGVRRISSGSPP